MPDLLILEVDRPKMVLSKPFLVNKYSSETLLTKFINERLINMVDCFYLDDKILEEGLVIVTFSKVYL